jgi:endonuclease G
MAAARKAEEDSFHYTNCAPQHRALNQRTWRDLEDYIIETAREGGSKALIFTGPIFRPDDMLYREQYLIPAEFWKVAAALDDEGELHAAAYLQTQKNLLPDLVEAAFGDYKTWRVPVATIAGLTGLDFGPLLAADGRALEEGSSRQSLVTGMADLDFF